MKYVDFGDIFSRRKADVAVLSTYEFDPLYFEHRLLFSSALDNARRILIFMDGNCYQKLAHSDVHARYVNERYLLIPVFPPRGVFHPKLHLLVSDKGATVFCGSNNLTQAGCTNNLEMVNAIDVEKGDEESSHFSVLRAAMDFYQGCLELCERGEKRLADRFLRELLADRPWLKSHTESGPIQLVDTLTSPLLPVVQAAAEGQEVTRFLIVSPFFDKDLRLLKKIRTVWPKCEVDLVAQEQTGNLPTKVLSKIRGKIQLHRIHVPNGRRLHAKLLAAFTDESVVCCSGSANFTSAAFEGHNVETCLIMRAGSDALESLFDKEIRIERVDAADFDPGTETEPKTDVQDGDRLTLHSATLSEGNLLSLAYSVENQADLTALRVAIRRYGDEQASTMVEVPIRPEDFTATAIAQEKTKEFHGAVQCYLVGKDREGHSIESRTVWLVQESRLTRERGSGSGGSDRERIIRDTGRGTTEYLDELAQREGHRAVIQFLAHLNIRYQSGVVSGRGHWGFNIGVRDPTTSDEAPQWTILAGASLEAAIFDFVDRHHRNVLHKHARRGNINGLANFLDVFVECNKLLFLYQRRGSVRPLFAMEKILRGIGLMTDGYHFLEEDLSGYISRMRFELAGDDDLVVTTLQEAHAPEHLCIALLMAQIIRLERDGKGCEGDYLKDHANRVGACLGPVAVSRDTLGEALNFYSFLSDDDKERWVSEVMAEPFLAERAGDEDGRP